MIPARLQILEVPFGTEHPLAAPRAGIREVHLEAELSEVPVRALILEIAKRHRTAVRASNPEMHLLAELFGIPVRV